MDKEKYSKAKTLDNDLSVLQSLIKSFEMAHDNNITGFNLASDFLQISPQNRAVIINQLKEVQNIIKTEFENL